VSLRLSIIQDRSPILRIRLRSIPYYDCLCPKSLIFLKRFLSRIVRRIFEFDPDNPAGENLQVDLYNEFDIEISGLEGGKYYS
jgi:hypothetical protein